jgi:hypothetical protein
MRRDQFAGNARAPVLDRNDSGTKVDPVSGESGIYRSYGDMGPIPPAPVAWDDDEITSVRHQMPRDATPRAALPAQPRQFERSALQVGILLRGDELDRLWQKNAGALAERLFVWSEHTASWVLLRTLRQASAAAVQAPIERMTQRSVGRHEADTQFANPAAPAGRQGSEERAELVDLTSQARLLGTFFTRGHMPGLVALIFGIVAALALLPQRRVADGAQSLTPSPAVFPPLLPVVLPTPSGGGVPRTKRAQVADPLGSREAALEGFDTSAMPDIVPAEELPLVGSDGGPTLPSGNGSSAVPAVTRLFNLRQFDTHLARRAIDGAVFQARRCTHGEVSGSVLITFEPSGAATDVRFNSMSGDTSRAKCLMAAFQAARVGPFAGNPVVVKKSFLVNS